MKYYLKRYVQKSLSSEWIENLDFDLSEILTSHGISCPDDLLQIRFFDFLNLNRIDASVGYRILMSLYEFMNYRPVFDDLLMYGETGQKFRFMEFRARYKKLERVTLADMIFYEHVNAKAMNKMFEHMRRAFMKSSEFNSREYRYRCYKDLMDHYKEEEEKLYGAS